jgi:hypothetical protein
MRIRMWMWKRKRKRLRHVELVEAVFVALECGEFRGGTMVRASV